MGEGTARSVLTGPDLGPVPTPIPPATPRARAAANLAALRLATDLQTNPRPLTHDDRATLTQWSSWGALPDVFDTSKTQWQTTRAQLRELVGETGYNAAARTTINAHYTHPELVQTMWDQLRHLGFTGGRVLEPGAGQGVFIAKAPTGAAMTGIELDPATARITAALHPAATIRNESFADTRLPESTFDATIGNVPFANVTLHDPTHNLGGHRLHNHFILKSLHLTKPGGVAAVLTSRFTMDSLNQTARFEMSQLADLVAAVRLPTGAHREMAGTEAVTDLLIFRRLADDQERLDSPDAWLKAEKLAEHPDLSVNTYWQTHPTHVLGDVQIGHGMHGQSTLAVINPTMSTLPAQVQQVLAPVVSRAVATGHGWSPKQVTATATTSGTVDLTGLGEPTASMWNGHMAHVSGHTFAEVADGQWRTVKTPKTYTAELKSLLALRDAAVELVESESRTRGHDAATEDARARAKAAYQRYVDTYGPVNRFTERIKESPNPDEPPKVSRIKPGPVRIFNRDPHAPVVLALEDFDPGTQVANPAPILIGRVMSEPEPITHTSDPSEALAVSLNTTGKVDLDQIADLLDTTPAEARDQLGTAVFADPAQGDTLVPANQYLSGNVRTKLAQAQAADAEKPGRYAANIAALQEAMPRDLGMDEISARMGASWIDPATHQAFLSDILDDASVKVENPHGSIWSVEGKKWTVAATSTWGTDRRSAIDIAQSVMQQAQITVYDTTIDDKRILNMDATAAAQEKATAMQERFSEWVWEDPARAERLHARYNTMFNSIRLPNFAAEGQRLTFPGMADSFTPRAHQREAVARMIAQPSTGLWHEVGAGKTAAMVAGVTELKRLGLVTKPMIVVPNHMLDQVRNEWLELYPNARILAGGREEFKPANRRDFIARAATHNWDGVVVTHRCFESLPVRPETEVAYHEAQIGQFREALEKIKAEAAGSGRSMSVKQMEKQLLAREERIKKLMDTSAKDAGLTFEATGVDYVVYDEAHGVKNLSTPSRIASAAIAGSGKATDLHMKLEHLRDQVGHVGTLATATPIANSVTEAHVALRYLAPELLEAADVTEFDKWAATFGEVTTNLEFGVEGGGKYRPKSRLAKFGNVPELLTMVHAVADIRTAADLDLPVPKVAVRESDGQRGPAVVQVPASPELEDYIQRLAARAEDVRAGNVDPTEDNLLKISSDGRKAALDIRLVNPDADPGPDTKVVAAADKITETWAQYRDTTYLDSEGQPHPVPGALQLVFADQGVPKADGSFDVYNALKAELITRGLPAESIRFMSDYQTPAAKAQLFAEARTGAVAVLIGSTERMGTGTNVQTRLAALHHLDAPWRPADVRQRDGRAVRQGNQHAEVRINTYITEGSFDAFMWQGLERKAGFINAFMKGDLDTREVNDVGDEALSFAEVKALASGDPLILDKAAADSELNKYERLHRAWAANQTNLRGIISQAETSIEFNTKQLPVAERAAEQVIDISGEKFTARIDAATFNSRADTIEALGKRLAPHQYDARWLSTSQPLGELLTVGRTPFQAELTPGMGAGQPTQISTWVEGLSDTKRSHDLPDVLADPGKVVRAAEHTTKKLTGLPDDIRDTITAAETRIEQATADLGRPFKHDQALRDARAEVERIAAKMAATTAEQATGDQTPAQAAATEWFTAEKLPKAAPGREAALAAAEAKLRGLQPEVMSAYDHYRTQGMDPKPAMYEAITRTPNAPAGTTAAPGGQVQSGGPTAQAATTTPPQQRPGLGR